MTHDYIAAQQFVIALTGDANTIMDWRAIHDTDKAVPAWNYRGSLLSVWSKLVDANASHGRGIFAMVNETDGVGRELTNVTAARAHMIDLDDPVTANALRMRASAWSLKPTFEVWSSPGKFHVYWRSERYIPGDHYGDIQRRLVAMFGGDHKVVDSTRVMRVPGFYHLKNPTTPHMVTFQAGPGAGDPPLPWSAFQQALASTPPIEGGGGMRSGLGDPKLAAPSLADACNALDAIDPNDLQRDEWIKITAAFKQSVSTHTDDATAFKIWSDWCARYTGDDPGENRKQWRDITDTKAGWKALLDRSGLRAVGMFGAGPGGMPTPQSTGPTPGPVAQAGAGAPPIVERFPTFLNPAEQARYFKGCVLITKDERILTPYGRFMGSGKFNAAYGGHQFMIKEDGNGSTTDEPWKAATRGQLYQVPKVDHIRFLPAEEPGAIITDELGRKGVNTYIPANIEMREGDPSPFVNHLRRVLSTEQDVLIVLNRWARMVQSPGVKIPWAIVIQSTEGAGKNVFKFCLSHAMGSVYTYYPKASELAETGGKFNAWMRSKLYILCDEVKTDDKRNLIEALKDLISEERAQVQGKGVDQDLEDNFANWDFFTNWEDAIPIDRKSRRFAIFYSPMQSPEDLLAAGMGSEYFSDLYDWVKHRGGKQIVAHYLKHFKIDPAYDPAIHQRAPVTSSHEAAIVASRTAPEAAIYGALDSARQGFRGGWVSSVAVTMVLKENDIRVAPQTVGKILRTMGFTMVGQATRAYPQEEYKRANLWNRDPHSNIMKFGNDQGYE